MKRLCISISCLALVVCLCFGSVLFVSAEDMVVDGRTVVNYMDYIEAYDLTGSHGGWAILVFDDDMFTSRKYDDYNGYSESVRGSRAWNLKIPVSSSSTTWVMANIPGAEVNNTFLDVTNIPVGSYLQVFAIADFKGLSAYQSELEIWISSGITYYDENFQYISDSFSESAFYPFDEDSRFSQLIEMRVEPPSNAKYCSIFSSCSFGVGRSNDFGMIDIEFQFSRPSLKISTTYTQIIVEGIVKAKPPDNYDTIIDLGELESILNGKTHDGFHESSTLYQSAPAVISQFLSGFRFMYHVIDSLATANWINSILIVSLALGLFGFITNAGVSVGKAIEHKSKGGKK